MDPRYFKSHTMYWGTLGTVRPFPSFRPQKDVVVIHEALQKKDAGTLVRILTNRTNAQRQEIAKTFKGTTQQDLVAVMKKLLSGDLETFMLELMMRPLQHEAHRLQQAMAKQEVAGVVERDIEALAASLDGKKADAAPWIDILTSRDINHLKKVLLGLQIERGQMVIPALEKRFSGDIRLGLSVLVQCIQHPDVYLAKRLTGMKAPVVQSIMVSHSEKDLLCIRVAFLKLAGTSLYTTLQKHFKGDHLQALLAICRSED
uniref:annexin A2 isoform X5 n=1 Tax=Doryrhamphus excisus TaxID=161450 RepID=UPI0025AE3995|nr:annexin A2 isoform X5 [Doryrhamphus excisus]